MCLSRLIWLAAIGLHGLTHCLGQSTCALGSQKIGFNFVQRVGIRYTGLLQIVERNGFTGLIDQTGRQFDG